MNREGEFGLRALQIEAHHAERDGYSVSKRPSVAQAVPQ